MKLALSVSWLFMLVAGCATQAGPTSEAVPAKSVLSASALQPVEGAAKVIVKRDPGILGSGCDHRILLDGAALADLRPGEFIAVFPGKGEHILSLQQRCLGIASGGNELAVQGEGKPRTFRTSVQPSGVAMLMQTAN